MKLTRRNFLAWAGVSAVGAVACEGFGIREGEFSLQSPVNLPEDLVRGKDNWYATLCRQCPSSEGIVVRVMEGRAKKIQGNPIYPTNMGKQSARCEAGLQAMYHPDRISGPMRRAGSRGSGQFEPLDWKPALDTLKFQLQNRGGSMLMITEPLRGNMATLVDRFTQAVGGTHLGFETLDNNTYREALKNVYRQDLLPDFDLEHTSFLLSFGADFLSTWVSPTRWNRGYGEFRQGEARKRGTFYHVDPRFSMTAANADQWLPIKPGWEGHLALSLAYVIIAEGRAPGVDVGGLTNGQGAAALEAYRPEAVAERIGFTEDVVGDNPAEVIRQLARDFAGNLPSLAIGGGSSGAHTNGLFNLEAIYALNYLVGSVGTPGGVTFNPDSPIPEILPAASRVASLADWSSAADDLRNGRTNLVLLHGADPVHGLPGSLGLGDALNREDIYIVSFSPFLDETSVMADLILPDRVYLEDWGSDVPEPGPGYQTVGMQQPVINPLADLDPRSFPDVLLTMADELGKREELPWDRYQDFLKECSDRLFELTKGSNRGSIKAASADEFWTTMLQQGGWWDTNALAAAPASLPVGLYNGIVAKAAEPSFPGVGLSGDSFYLVPFSHNTLLDGQNAHLPWLQAAPDPLTTIAWQTWVEINDHDAQGMGLREGDLVQVGSSRGSILALVYPTPAVPPKVVCVPLGQGRRSGPDAASGRPGKESANVMSILEPSLVDGTGSLAWANTRVTITPTGNSVKVSKFEGIVRAVEVGVTTGERIIRTIGVEDL